MTMPYSTVFKPTVGQAHLIIPEEMRNGNHIQAFAPPGVMQVIVTWRGKEGIRIRHYRGSSYEVIHSIPASTTATPRTSGVLTLSSAVEQSVAVLTHNSSIISWDPDTLSKGYVAGVQIIPLATPGGV